MRAPNLSNLFFAFCCVISSTIFSSCSKEETTYLGVIRFSGELSVDGCGWVIDLESGPVHPTNLESQYQIDSLKIELSFKELGPTFNCGFGSTNLKQIEIQSINPI